MHITGPFIRMESNRTNAAKCSYFHNKLSTIISCGFVQICIMFKQLMLWYNMIVILIPNEKQVKDGKVIWTFN